MAVDLTESSFDHFINENEYSFILFYAPWCGHCKKLKPDFDKAAEHYNETKKAALGKLDCTEYPRICEKYKVSAYPTMKFFVNGDPFEYTGGR